MNSVFSFNLLRTGIMILDTECRVVELNHAAERLLGYSGRQVKNESLFKLIQADFDRKILLQLALQQESGFIEEAHLKTAYGEVNANLLLSSFETNATTYILLELQTNEYNSHIRKDIELQHQNRVSNHLIRNLAHEIKNPLGGIKGAAQLLERKLPDDFSNQYSQIIIQEADRLGELVNRLLLPAEPEAKTWVNVHQLIEKALEIVLLQHPQGIRITKDYDPSLPELNLCAGQIQQSLLNLIKNAAEAVKENPTITLKTRIQIQQTIGEIQHRQVLRIDVMDNGCGIDASIKNDIFFPTISGKNSSGLGLSIAQSLVQRHGGIIEVESEPGSTCFSVFLPLEKTHE